MNLTGRWKGYYIYGNGYGLPYFGQKVEFESEMIQRKDEVSGVITEKGEYSVPMEATFSGFVQGNFLSFIKNYPGKAQIDEEGDLNVEANGNSHEIHYQGYLDQEHDSIYGRWSISQVVRGPFGEEMTHICEGLWLIKRE
ncbi:MAG: hypothetical protein MRZ79_23580 [Bacteroidia bacterium]|nr:hypothetical protein [Bacteroidia bacterium]